MTQIDLEKLIPDEHQNIKRRRIKAPLGKPNKGSWFTKQLEALGKKLDFTLDMPIKDISKEAIQVLYGSDMELETYDANLGIRSLNKDKFKV